LVAVVMKVRRPEWDEQPSMPSSVEHNDEPIDDAVGAHRAAAI
jgi:hypothetical protein